MPKYKFLKSIVQILFAITLLLHLQPSPAYAQDPQDVAREAAISIGKELDISGIDMDNHVKSFISQPESILNVQPADIFSSLWQSVKGKLTQPIKILGVLFTIILLSAILQGFGGTVVSHNLEQIFGTLSVLLCVTVLGKPLSDAMSLAAGTIRSGSDFLLGFVPIFSSIVAASGGFTSAASYSVVVLTAAELFSQISKIYLMPLLGLCMAVAVVESANPSISLGGIADAVKRIAVWGLTLMLTIFVGLLTIQSVIGVSTDSVAIRTGKFMISNFIPVVGGAISDAYTTIKGSLGILRGGVGVFGIVALILTMLPSILSIWTVQISVWIAGIAAELLGVNPINKFLKSTASVLSIVMGVLLCFLVLLIISTTIVMMISMQLV